MYIKLTFFFSLFVCLACSSQSIAQEQDRIVTLNGDTIKCRIKINFVRATKYKTPDMADYEKFDVRTVKYYYIAEDDARFKAAIRPGKKKVEYLRLIEEGKICLYEHVSSTNTPTISQSITNWFVSKENDTLYRLKSSSLFNFTSQKDRKNVLLDMLADKPEVLKQYEDTDSFSFKNLRNAIHLYNTGQPFVDKRSFIDKALSPF